MAKFGPFKDALVVIDGLDMSDHCAEITVNTTTAELPNSAMGDYCDFKTPGLLSYTLEGKFYSDFAAGSINDKFEALRKQLETLGVPPTFTWSVNPSKTSPIAGQTYSGLGFISKWKPIGGKHGDNLMTEVTIAAAGNLTVS